MSGEPPREGVIFYKGARNLNKTRHASLVSEGRLALSRFSGPFGARLGEGNVGYALIVLVAVIAFLFGRGSALLSCRCRRRELTFRERVLLRTKLRTEAEKAQATERAEGNWEGLAFRLLHRGHGDEAVKRLRKYWHDLGEKLQKHDWAVSYRLRTHVSPAKKTVRKIWTKK